MKPWRLPATTPTFLMRFATSSAVASTSGAVLAPRTTSSRRITFAGEKKCIPSTSAGRLVKAAIWSIQVGGVRGQDRAGLGHGVELAEHVLLDRHGFEHGFDDQVGFPSASYESVRLISASLSSIWATVKRPFFAEFS